MPTTLEATPATELAPLTEAEIDEYVDVLVATLNARKGKSGASRATIWVMPTL